MKEVLINVSCSNSACPSLSERGWGETFDSKQTNKMIFYFTAY
jgi:hypothetical protein